MAPVLLLKTIESPWFKIVDLIGTIAFALSGLIIALEKKSTLLAGILFALLPSFGGGVVRDVMFGIAPVQVLRTAYYFITILSVVLGGYLVTFLGTKKISNFFNRMIPKKIKDSHVGDDNPYLVITDAMGLAAFTISGVFVTLLAKIEPLWLWGPLFSLMTGVLGGVIRDIIAHRKISALNGDLYPEWCILGGFFLAFYIDWYSLDMTQELMTRGILMTLLGVFFLRVISYIFNIKSPIFK